MKKDKPTEKTKALGLMSGTSLDGLDLAAISFWRENEKWCFEINAAETFPYSEKWEQALRNAHKLSGEELTQLDWDYGYYLGEQIVSFLKNTNFAPDFIASHGHTVFHRPECGFTLQIGRGAAIAAKTGIKTVADFRSGDVALGGQGAPLVPIGDRLLFSRYDYCLNLGGFANVSFEKDGQRIAFDICPVNIVLNALAEDFGLRYDKDGELGRLGKVDHWLLQQLDGLAFYAQKAPKSLGREWLENEFLPVLKSTACSKKDRMATVYEHIARQIADLTSGGGSMLVSGGGAFNRFLLERIAAKTQTQLVVPDESIVNFKEALVFAFLGLLRLGETNNCLASVTGARHDSSSGIVFVP